MTDTDAVGEALAARRRRYVLYALLEAGDAALADLTGLIAAAESGRPAASVPAERRRRIALDLAGTHLPVLEAHGFVDHDREHDSVSLAPASERATPYLELASRFEPPPAAGGSV